MNFVKCHECRHVRFQSIDALQAHYSIKHPTCTFFRCVIEECGRLFNMWNSFRKHLQKKHNVPNHFTLDACKNVMQQNSFSNFNVEYCETDIVHESEIVHETETVHEIETVHETELFDNISSGDFHNLLKKHANILVSKINNKPGLPRNQVDSVIEDISTFLNGSFLNILK